MKIITFVFAGGNKYSFPKFSKTLTDFTVLEYPGRGTRINEKLMKDIDLLTDDLLPKIVEEIKNCHEYIVYGHSMGALVGYLICQKLQKLQIKKPLKLVVSGRKAPSIKREKLLSDLPNHLFWEEVIKLGGIPDALQEHPELKEFYIPILKADFEVVDNYNYVKKEKLNIPIDVFYGTEEKITEFEITEWENESTQEVTINRMKGNHFFIFNNEDFFIDYFKHLNNKLTPQRTNA